MEIRLNAEQTKKFKACFIDEARRILAERQRAARREQLESQEKEKQEGSA